MRIGIVGAGNIGQGLARLATAAGHDVSISNSRGPESLSGLALELGATARTVVETVTESDLSIVSVPFTRVFTIDPTPFRGRVVVDTNNYYPRRDGRIEDLDGFRTTTSEMVQNHFVGASVVKAFNAILASDLTAPHGLPGQLRALPIAGDDAAALKRVAAFHRDIGFDVHAAGPLADSWRLERAKPAYCTPLNRAELQRALASAEREVELPHNSWKRN
ncbi:MAG: coenzyme F420-dependent oxidoreductase [Pseudarthrobacter sp.]|nr:coenzyme F420-dependent oxidoreductase [Pseudarthrobacter sp.]